MAAPRPAGTAQGYFGELRRSARWAESVFRYPVDAEPLCIGWYSPAHRRAQKASCSFRTYWADLTSCAGLIRIRRQLRDPWFDTCPLWSLCGWAGHDFNRRDGTSIRAGRGRRSGNPGRCSPHHDDRPVQAIMRWCRNHGDGSHHGGGGARPSSINVRDWQQGSRRLIVDTISSVRTSKRDRRWWIYQ